MMEQKTLMPQERKRKFYSETDFLRVEVRKLAAELKIEIKNSGRLTKAECREILEKLNRIKFNREKGLLRKLFSYFY